MFCLRLDGLYKRSVLLAAFLVLIPISSSAQGPSKESGKAPSPGRSLSQEEQESLVQKIWWNQEDPIASLELDDKQRGLMDGALRTFMGGQGDRRDAVRSAHSEFSSLLEKNEIQEAREAALRIGKAAGAAAQTQAELKIEVLSMLNAAQQTKLTSDYAHLFRQPWIRLNMQIGRQGDRGAMRSRLRKKEDG